jgi:hypothetical protein
LKHEDNVKELKRLSKKPSTPQLEAQKVRAKAQVDLSKNILDDSAPVLLIYCDEDMKDFACIDLTLEKNAGSFQPFYNVVGYYR